jgi:hypothetical protein
MGTRVLVLGWKGIWIGDLVGSAEVVQGVVVLAVSGFCEVRLPEFFEMDDRVIIESSGLVPGKSRLRAVCDSYNSDSRSI